MTKPAVGIGLIGCGTVGGGVATLLQQQADLYRKRLGRPIELRRVLVRDVDKAKQSGLVDPRVVLSDPDEFFSTPDISIVVEVAGGLSPAYELVCRAMESGRHVVTANKSLLAAHGAELFSLARKQRVAIAFEPSCAGGIPCITALQFGLMANEIRGIYGILNGTCNYILTAMTRQQKSYSIALKEAQDQGFAEADPTLDVSGRDAAQKLAILASIAFGARIVDDQVEIQGIDQLALADIKFGSELGYDIKLLAIAEQTGANISVRVEPCFIHADELLAQVDGAFNALSVFGHALGHGFFYGPGAGRMPTASAVVSDLLNVASGAYTQGFATMRLTPDQYDRARLISPDDLVSRFYLRLNALDRPGVMAQVTQILGAAKISFSAVLQHESATDQFVPVVILTHDARYGDLVGAAQCIEQLEVIQGNPVLIRIMDMPKS